MRRIRRVTNRYDDMILATNNLWGYWPLGEFTGTRAADLGKNRFDGVYSGGYTLGKSSFDDKNSGVLFNGTSGELNVTHNTALNQGDTGSWEIWLKRNGINTVSPEVFWDKGTNTFTISFSGTGASAPANYLVFDKDNVANICRSNVTLTDTTRFHHIVVTKNGAASFIYLDGVDVTGTITNQTLANTTVNLHIASIGGNFWTNGTLLRAAMYGRALTAGEVREHYTVGLGA